MKAGKNKTYKVKFELENGEILVTETDGHIGHHISFVKRELAPKVYGSKVKEIIERWIEETGDKDEKGNQSNN